MIKDRDRDEYIKAVDGISEKHLCEALRVLNGDEMIYKDSKKKFRTASWIIGGLAAAFVFAIIGSATVQLIRNAQNVGNNPLNTDETEDTKESSTEELQEDTTESTTEDEEAVTLVVYSQWSDLGNGSDGEFQGWMADILLEKFHVKLDIRYADDMENVPEDADIICWNSSEDPFYWDDSEEKYMWGAAIEAGELLDWNEDNLLERHGSYIMEHLTNALEYSAGLNDGVVYGIGCDCAEAAENAWGFIHTWNLRWDLYEKLGCPFVRNLDEYAAMLENMKQICPKNELGNETYAVSLNSKAGACYSTKQLAEAYFGYSEHYLGLYDMETGAYYDCLAENGPYLQALKFLNLLYQKGLLDPDSRTQKYAGAYEKLQAGQVFMCISDSDALGYNTEEHIAQNQMMLPVVPGEASPMQTGMNITGRFSGKMWSISAKTEYKERCMDIINWLYTPEGVLTSHYGPQGLCWDYNDEGYLYLTDFGYQCEVSSLTKMPEGYSGETFYDGCLMRGSDDYTMSIYAANSDSLYGESYYYRHWKLMQEEPSCELEKVWREEFAKADSIREYMKERGNYTVLPRLELTYGFSKTQLTEEMAEQEGIMLDDLMAIIEEGSWDAIYAESDEEFAAIVSKMTENAKKAGYDKCIEIYQNDAKIRYEAEEALR